MEQGGESSSRYWCHMCSQMVNPLMEIGVMKCPICESGFVEEMGAAATATATTNVTTANEGGGGGGSNNSDSDRALSLWAPILLGMMANPIRHRLLRPTEEEEEDEAAAAAVEAAEEEESLMRRRRRMRSSAAILHLLQTIRAGLLADNGAGAGAETEGTGGGGVIFINPFNQTIVLQGERPHLPPTSSSSMGLGDYFIGPGLDMLLQHLAENDPNRYGTPPAQKEVVDALPTVTIEEEEEEGEAIQCAVCLDECEVGCQVKEMPCKHKFHTTCILPWLQMHSSCPVCRYQLPADDSKLVSSDPSANTTSNAAASAAADDEDNGIRRFSVPLLWPFTALFPSSTSQATSTGAGSPSLTYPSASSSTDAAPTVSHAEDSS